MRYFASSFGVVLLATAAGCTALAPRSVADTATPAMKSLTPESAQQAAHQVVVTFRDERPALTIEAGASPSLQASRPGYAGSAYARRILRGLARDYQLKVVTDWYIESLGVHCVVYFVTDSATREAVLARIQQDPRVADAQPMNEFHTLTEPRDNSSTAQSDPYSHLQIAAARIGLSAAQRFSSGRGVRIAVIDTGFDDVHPDLLGRIESTENLVNTDATQFRRDRHGTAVAGTIAANSGNGAGIRGVAPESRLIGLKACWEVASNGSAACNSLTLAAALESAIRRRVQVINLSLTGPNDRLLASLVGKATEKGILVVGAMEEDSTKPHGFPGGVPGVIAVVNADKPTANLNAMAAPGSEILTLTPGGHYDYASGVSISTAMVSGVVALLLERAPKVERAKFIAQLPRLLRETAVQRLLQAPEINAARAIQAALR